MRAGGTRPRKKWCSAWSRRPLVRRWRIGHWTGTAGQWDRWGGVFQARRQRQTPRESRFSGAMGRLLWGTLGLRPSLHAVAPKWGVRLPVSLAALPGPRAGGLRAGLPRRAVGPDQPGWITAQATRGPELPAGCVV